MPKELHDNRARILAAAADLFSKHGFRGATTKRIALQAGVNEVTIFRAFGTKDELISQALHSRSKGREALTLPSVPQDPQGELTIWCANQLAYLRRERSMVRTCMSEIEDRPHLAPNAAHGPQAAREQLRVYLRSLSRQGYIQTSSDQQAAIAMLLGVCFADAMGRDIMPDMFPSPVSTAARQYTKLFLKSLGFQPRPSAKHTTTSPR